MKIYEYKGMLVQVPDDVTHLSLCSDGVLRAWCGEPNLNLNQRWEEGNSIAPVILNWQKNTCATSLLKEYAPVVLHELAPPGTQRYSVGDKYPLHLLIDNEEHYLNAEIHVVVSCYTLGMMLWCQVLKLKVEGLSIDNVLLASVKEVLHELG